jgi:CRISPR-associated protein Cas2
MQYVICYDISDDGRRGRVAHALLDFGSRIQESVFVANLDQELAGRMMERLAKLMESEQDRLHVFELCGACSGRTKALGRAELVEDREFYVI